MKKLFLVFVSFFSVLTVQAHNLTEGKHYTALTTAHSAQPEVVEFFSFYCPHCYSFEYEYKIPAKVKASLPQGVELKQYHVNFLGPQGENLTRAWSFAVATGVEEKVKEALFQAAQKNALRSMGDIRQIFLDKGIPAEQFDGGINSFAVTALMNKQIHAAEELKVRGVPDFYINNRYRVKPEGLSTNSNEAFVKDYVETVKGLLQK
ncbi:DsbA family thiol:disulfide interchange protein [Pasteurella multocida subsp. multocida OH4807]|nr:DsbA family thiol:disulfide interchange protein [Pasteurella multocida subsp. multocida OH4807]